MTRDCLECGKAYTPRHSGRYQKYCRAACSQRAYRKLNVDRYREIQRKYWKQRGNAWNRDRKRQFKVELVEMLGGGCALCGYDRSLAALDFDHKSPQEKTANIAALITGLRWDEAREEAKKCRLLCKNCHAEQTWPEASLW